MFTYSQFYRRHEMASRWGIKAAGGSVAGAFGGLLGSGLGNIPKAGIFERWRWIFLVEGLITIAVAGFVYWFMPSSAAYATFLTEEQRALAIRRIDEENKMHVGGEELSPWRPAVIKKALWNANTQLVSLGIMMSLLSLTALSLFMVCLGSETTSISPADIPLALPAQVHGLLIDPRATAYRTTVRAGCMYLHRGVLHV